MSFDLCHSAKSIRCHKTHIRLWTHFCKVSNFPCWEQAKSCLDLGFRAVRCSGSSVFATTRTCLFGVRSTVFPNLIFQFDWKTKSVEPQFSNILNEILVNLVSDKRLLGFWGLLNIVMNLYYLCGSIHALKTFQINADNVELCWYGQFRVHITLLVWKIL